MKIGNWEVDTENEEIIWKGKGKTEIVLDKTTFFVHTLDKFIKKLIYITERDFVNESDVFALNSALMYAFEKFDIIRPDGFSFSKLIEEQIKIILEKDDYPDEIVM